MRSASRADFADNRVRVNLAAFYVDYNQRILPVGGTECTWRMPGGLPYVYNTIPPADRHADSRQPGQPSASATTSRTFYQNIPATIQGAELEVQFAPIDGLTISAAVRLHGLPGRRVSTIPPAG